MQQEPGLGGDDRLLAVTTLSFDIAALELFLPLLTGARLVLASGETARDGVRLQRRLQEAEITVMQATPATWRLLLETGWAGDRNLRIWCGGEALTRELAEQLLPRCAALWNMYGPTETTIWSAVERIEPGTGPIRIGLPVANTEFYVLDGNLQLLPVGIAGELHIGGQGLARGYLHQAELTEQKFIAHPFRAQAGSRLYKTGDLVRRLGDGRLEFLGRLDDQVKVRGFRIELGEIESALSRRTGVKAAVVDARVGDGLQEKQLVAYVVPQGTVSAEDLRAALRQRLPDYMVPSQFVFLSSLPLTPNGKVNRRALPGPGTGRTGDGGKADAAARRAGEETGRDLGSGAGGFAHRYPGQLLRPRRPLPPRRQDHLADRDGVRDSAFSLVRSSVRLLSSNWL